MAVTYGFYNSLNKDRMYNAEQMSSIFNGIITDGVFSTIGDALMTVAGTGMQVIVKPGRAWFNSTWTLNDALLPLDIPAADVSLTRIDAVVVEINSAISTRANTIKVIKGTPSANPVKPTLANTETLHQYALGYVTVSAGVTSITADKIEVNVGKGTCPFITSVLQQTDITALFNQWDAEFNTWFANVQAQLSGNVAANLQRQIDENKSLINENYEKTLKPYTKGLLSIPVDSTPDDAFLALFIGVGAYGYRVKVQLADGTPVEGATINGIDALPGSTLISGADGIVIGKSTSQSVTISCTSPYIDQAPPASKTIASIGTITDVTIALIAITDTITVSNSKKVKASPNAKTMDITAVGGGGGGGSFYGCGGGGGGNIAHALNIDLSSRDIKIFIGASGASGGTGSSTPIEQRFGHAGGTTDVKFDGAVTSIVSATGGGGGGCSEYYNSPGGSSSNGGRGGNGHPSMNASGMSGNACVVHIFDDPNLPIAGGGGGGGGCINGNASPGQGGAPNGGAGGGYSIDAHSGNWPGGGGGGGGTYAHRGKSGANGCVYLRFHF